jgi:hypothetical protein
MEGAFVATWQFWAAAFVGVMTLFDAYWIYTGRANERLERRGRTYSPTAARYRIAGDLLLAVATIGLAIEWALDRRLGPVATLRLPLVAIGVVLILGPWGRTHRVTPAPEQAPDGAGPASPPIAPTAPRRHDMTGEAASGEHVRILTDSEKAALAAIAPPAAEAAWYPDPFEPDVSRYWNGRQWTGRTRRTNG